MGCLLAATKGLENTDMMISTRLVRPLPYERLKETIVCGEDMIGQSSREVSLSYISSKPSLTGSLLSTACRLAVSVPKLSNVKHEGDTQGWESVHSLQCNAKHSLDAAAQADAYLVRLPRVGGHPQGEVPTSIYDPHRANARNKNTLVVLQNHY